MSPYEQKLAALGITNRGQLATGFEDGGLIEPFKVAHLLNPEAPRSTAPPPVEDLSQLNPPNTELFQKAAKKIWTRMTPEERRRRAKVNAISAMKGGAATKGVSHRHH